VYPRVRFNAVWIVSATLETRPQRRAVENEASRQIGSVISVEDWA
jgi:hypothetical protein